jgi:two-component system sensor histidine kinase KdpD
MRKYRDLGRIWVRKAMAPSGITGVVMALVLVAGTDGFLWVSRYFHLLPPVSLTFLIPIVVAAIRWGTLSATVTALGGAVSVTYYFYVSQDILNDAGRSRFLGVVFFLVVSLACGYLASRTRRDAARALMREDEIRDLYIFSQRLSAAHSPADIFEAMQQHLGMLVGRKVLLFDSMGTPEAQSERLSDVAIPDAVMEAIADIQAMSGDRSNGVVIYDDQGSAWLVRPVSVNTADFGVVVVDLGQRPETFEDLRTRVVAVISDAASFLERLGLARTIAEARTRAETEHFREALIGSVSQELRTPLSAILDASLVLSQAPEVTANPRLNKLSALVHQESERLNIEIQNILDASRISSDGLQARLEWAEPADVVNAALLRCHNRLATRTVEVALPDELILLPIDSALMERALGLILDNAAKYSPADTVINIRGQREASHFVISVIDLGVGLDADDEALLGQKFFRGKRHSQITPGLGLGFWVARAFVTANNGTLETVSAGPNKGMTVTIRLPLSMKEDSRDEDHHHDRMMAG